MASGLWRFSTSYIIIFLAALVSARPRIPHADGSIAHFRGRAFTISQKPCRDANDVEGVCMFTWDCISKNGKLLSTCLDGFLLGTCCQLQTSTRNPMRPTTSSVASSVRPTGSVSTVANSSSITNYVSKSPLWASSESSSSSSSANSGAQPSSSTSSPITVTTLLSTTGLTHKLTTKDIQKEVHNLLSMAPELFPTKTPTMTSHMKRTTVKPAGTTQASPAVPPLKQGSVRPVQKFPSTAMTTTTSASVNIGNNKPNKPLSTSVLKPSSTKKPIVKITMQSSSNKPSSMKPLTSSTTAPPGLAQALTSSSVLSIIHQLTGSAPITSKPSKRPLSKLPSFHTSEDHTVTASPATTVQTTSPSAGTKSPPPLSSTKPASIGTTVTPAPLPKPLSQTASATTAIPGTPASTSATLHRPHTTLPGLILTTPVVTSSPTFLQTFLTPFVRPPIILTATKPARPATSLPTTLWSPTPSLLKQTLRPKPPMKPTKPPTTTTTAAPPLTVTTELTTSTTTNSQITNRPTTIVFDWTEPMDALNLTASDSSQSFVTASSNATTQNEQLPTPESTTQSSQFLTTQQKPTIALMQHRPTTVEVVGDNHLSSPAVEDAADSTSNVSQTPPGTAITTQTSPSWVTVLSTIFPTLPIAATQQPTSVMTPLIVPNRPPNNEILQAGGTKLPQLTSQPSFLSTITTSLSPTTQQIESSATTKRPHRWDYRKDCGVRPLRPQGRIVGGRNSQFGAWPWQVLVKEATWLGLFVKNKCGGVLINAKWVITAAHCQPSFLATLLVVLGEHDLTGDYEALKPITKNVRRMVVHRNYNSHTFENDIALLELETPVQFQPHVVPICLPTGNENFVGKVATVTGWGKLSHGGPVPSVLQEVHVPIVTNSKCQKMFLSAGHVKIIRDTFICAGYENGGLDSCEGDSGGPLMVQQDDGRWVLAGTVSHGIRCADPNLPGVYMRTSAYKPWMETIMKG